MHPCKMQNLLRNNTTTIHPFISEMMFLAAILTLLPLALSLSLRPRHAAPLFKSKAVLEDKFVDVSLSQYTEKGKWVVLLFYPFDYTFVCPTEIISFSEKAGDFAAIDTQVLAISTDSHHTHLAWSRTSRKDGGVGQLNIPLVADVSKRISTNYGVLVEDEDDDMFGAALRGLFIIDPKVSFVAFINKSWGVFNACMTILGCHSQHPD